MMGNTVRERRDRLYVKAAKARCILKTLLEEGLPKLEKELDEADKLGRKALSLLRKDPEQALELYRVAFYKARDCARRTFRKVNYYVSRSVRHLEKGMGIQEAKGGFVRASELKEKGES